MTFKIVVDGGRLGLAASAMHSFAAEGFIHLDNPAEMFMRATDVAGVGIVECKIPCVCEGDATMLAMEWDQIPTDMSGPIVLEIDHRMNIGVGRINYKVDLLVPSTVHKVPEPKVPFGMVFDLPAGELYAGLKAVVGKLDTKDTSASVRFSWIENEFIIEDGKQIKVDVTYEKKELVMRQEPVLPTFSSTFPATHIRSVTSMVGKFNRAIVAFGEFMPISVGVNGDNIGAGWFTAPMIPPGGK